jgi:hypothetical protein
VRASLGVQAFVGDHQPFHRPAAKDVRVEDFIDIRQTASG